MKLLIATDAWRPQVNGVVRTLERTGEQLAGFGVDVTVLSPSDFRTWPMPTYPEIRLARARPKTIAAAAAAAQPEAVHIATEGPIGFAVRRWCVATGRPFTTSFHTRFPEYLSARAPIPERLTYALLRRFHNAGRACMVATESLRRELAARGFEHLVPWTRGVDSELFRPREGAPTLDLPRPIFLFVGRVAVEKNIGAFLALDLPGSKVVVGDGPALPSLKAAHPEAHFLGMRTGEALAEAYANADVFVFPSRTDTFGIVLLEALAAGVPVAAYPVPGPADVIGGSGVGVLDEDLRMAALAALSIPRDKCRDFALARSWEASARQFHDNIVAANELEPQPVSRKRVAEAGGALIRATPMSQAPPGIAEIRAAAARLSRQAVRTPLLTSPHLDAVTGARVLIKPECLQRTGSFKFRGAYNALASLDSGVRARGVVAVSSGNHAQGVAEAARLFGVPSTIVMPADAPTSKLARTKRSGATIVTYDRATEDRDAVAARVIAERGGVLIHPYNDANVIAGQGTVGLEIAADAEALGLVLDLVAVPCSGGGLGAGVGVGVRAAFRDCAVTLVEPEGFDDYARSLREGRIVANATQSGSVCDALMAVSPGSIGFALNSAADAHAVAISDAEALAAVAFAFRELKLVVEPGGAVALAALLSGRLDARGKTVAIVLSGGNIDGDLLARALSSSPLGTGGSNG